MTFDDPEYLKLEEDVDISHIKSIRAIPLIKIKYDCSECGKSCVRKTDQLSRNDLRVSECPECMGITDD